MATTTNYSTCQYGCSDDHAVAESDNIHDDVVGLCDTARLHRDDDDIADGIGIEN